MGGPFSGGSLLDYLKLPFVFLWAKGKWLIIALLIAAALILTWNVARAQEDAAFGVRKEILSFPKTQEIMLAEVYHDRKITFYVGAPFDAEEKIISSDYYFPNLKYVNRAEKVEWEHVVPVGLWGPTFSEYTEGDINCVDKDGVPYKGRRCATKVSFDFKLMLTDMHNIVPAVGQINALRSDTPFKMIPGEEREFGPHLDLELTTKAVEPPEDIRGDIARIYMYMAYTYSSQVILTVEEQAMYQQWHRKDPVDEWEFQRNRRIQDIQGNTNPFVSPL